MKGIQRREFLRISAITALLSSINFPLKAFDIKKDDKKAKVHFTGDGLSLTPKEYGQLLAKLTEKDAIKADIYSLGGCIEDLEIKFAKLLGKEAAIFMPTGTLANQLAIRSLCGKRSRAIVQQESHVYNDTGDASQVLSNLNLIPLGVNKASFTAEEVEEVVKRTASGRVSARVGVISIESPVRRKSGEVFDYEEMKRISTFANSNDIKMHLDGARIFLATPYTGIKVTEYCSLFDTVYVSLYKYFNAASGAILAGTKDFIEPLFHTRRMFGSGLSEAWPFAVIANFYADGFAERFAKSVSISEELIQYLSKNKRFKVYRIPSGSNIFRLALEDMDAKLFAQNLNNRSIIVRPSGSEPNELILHTNESLLNSTAIELESVFIKSLSH